VEFLPQVGFLTGFCNAFHDTENNLISLVNLMFSSKMIKSAEMS